MKKLARFFLFVLLAPSFLWGQNYFPPNTGFWDTISPQQMGWCNLELSTLDSLLIAANTKSFIILKGGKIAYERYYNGFGPDSVWYWASAGKTLTASLIGIAQDEGLLDISDKSSDYLGRPWTSLSLNQEDLITIENQLSMTTGLDYQVPNQDCTADSCLLYRADAGTQWYYHNAPYLLLQDVIESASGSSLNLYTAQKYFGSIGLRGLWLNNVYFSNARAMARFGLLMLNDFNWAGQSLIADTVFIRQMKESSQALNPAYGYLTWLNGKSTYMQPGFSFSFPGAIIPTAPADLYMAAGKNDQRIYMVPSLDMVVIRQGEAADSSLLALSGFDDNLWQAVMKVLCQTVSLEANPAEEYALYPNPSEGVLFLEGPWSQDLVLRDIAGRNYVLKLENGVVNISHLPKGIYWLMDRESGKKEKVVLN